MVKIRVWIFWELGNESYGESTVKTQLMKRLHGMQRRIYNVTVCKTTRILLIATSVKNVQYETPVYPRRYSFCSTTVLCLVRDCHHSCKMIGVLLIPWPLSSNWKQPFNVGRQVSLGPNMNNPEWLVSFYSVRILLLFSGGSKIIATCTFFGEGKIIVNYVLSNN